ncbi:MAG TPA: type II toxin-antitoxin system RelE/ParE family toxin [Casimicrobiaceae bacterium]
MDGCVGDAFRPISYITHCVSLEALKGDRKGLHSIRINEQWRICFRWIDGDAHDVEIVDYH